jgi:hypothetical protein
MRHEPDEHASERVTDEGSDASRHARGRLFPYNTVVGVVDDPKQLDATVQGLVDTGFAESQVSVLCGRRGVEMIDAKGTRKGLLARVFRMVDGLGEEREHTEHHVRELEAGHFIVVVDVVDEAAKGRARDAMKSHGGHFINYYSRWSTEDLTP